MAARKSTHHATRSRTRRTSRDIDPVQLQQATQQGTHRQMVMAVDATSALLRSAELLGQVQLRAIQRSNQTWHEAAERMHTATSPMDIVTLQNQLVMNTLTQGMQFMQELMQAGAAMQPPNVSDAIEESGNTADVQPLAEMMQTPVMRAWQSMFNPMSMNGTTAHNGAG